MSRYCLPVIHSSACSMHKAPMSLSAEFLLGKIRTTLVRRLISWLNRSRPFVVRILLRCCSGKFRQVKASSPPSSSRSAASGYFSDKVATNCWSRSNPVSLSGARKMSSKHCFTQALSLFLTLSKMFFLKWTWHRPPDQSRAGCHWQQPGKFSSMAFNRPLCASLITRRTPLRPLSFNPLKNNDQPACHQSGRLVSFSLLQTSTPRISRFPVELTPLAIRTA